MSVIQAYINIDLLKDIPIHFEQPIWLLIPVLMLALAISAFLYYLNHKNVWTTSIHWLLFLLRFFALAILGILLLNPFLVHQKKTIEKPVVVIALDLSESMLNNQDSANFTRFLQKTTEDLKKGLSGQFDIDVLGFSHQVFENKSWVFDGKRTDIGQLLSYVRDKYYMLNLSSVVLLSDGQNNQGQNPSYLVQNESFEIDPVVIGDTIPMADVSIANIFYNKVVRQGSRFQVGVVVQAEGRENEKLRVKISHHGKIIGEQSIKIPSKSYNHEFAFEIKAAEKGLQAYHVWLVGEEKDANESNNSGQFYVQMVESGDQVLILGSGPHPDLGAIASALRAADGYDVVVKTLNDYPFDLSKYQLVILHGIPSRDERSKRLLANPQMKNKAIWYILNTSTDFDFLAEQDIPWEISKPKGAYEYADARYNSNFSNFLLPLNWATQTSHFPPLYVPFSNFQRLRKSDVMLWQSIRGFETDKPLQLFWSKGKRKFGLLTGEGLWKWRFYDFKIHSNHDLFNTFITRVSRYLLTGVFQNRFHIEYKNVYNETDQISWEAQIYNDAYEAIPEADIKLEVTDQNGNVYPYQFTADNGVYRLNFDDLKAGEYSFHALAKTVDTSFVKNGKFVVNAWNMERANMGANVELLAKLAHESGGKLYQASQINQLIENLKTRPDFKARSGFVQKVINLIDIKWLLAVVSMLLGLEWFLRKRNGSY